MRIFFQFSCEGIIAIGITKAILYYTMPYHIVLLYYITQTRKLVCEIRFIKGRGEGGLRNLLRIKFKVSGSTGRIQRLALTCLFQILFLIPAIYLTLTSPIFMVITLINT